MSDMAFSWHFTSTGVSSLLFAVDVVDQEVVWAAGQPSDGSVGAVVRTVDGGRSWQNVTPPGGNTLVFHDVEAFGRDQALVLAVGKGPASKIFRTDDGGASWQLAFDNQEQPAFYDGVAFFDSSRGLALSDPVARKFRILVSVDGGRTWNVAPTNQMPDVTKSEVARATGTSMVAIGPNDAWFGTAPQAANADSRVFHTRDGGNTWTAATVPIAGKPEFGVASLAFRNLLNGMAMGGGELGPDVPSIAAVTADGGETWSRAGSLSGFRVNLAWVGANTAVAVGPSGSDVTTDGGQTWHRFDQSGDLRGVSCRDGTCWAVGGNGMAAELVKGMS
jgi:photosystem II stability/assembly factor-like uncharacterized protein